MKKILKEYVKRTNLKNFYSYMDVSWYHVFWTILCSPITIVFYLIATWLNKETND